MAFLLSQPGPFRILGVEGTGEGIELGAPLGAGAASQIVTFRCQFARPGDFKRELKIKTSLQDAPVMVTIEGGQWKRVYPDAGFATQ